MEERGAGPSRGAALGREKRQQVGPQGWAGGSEGTALPGAGTSVAVTPRGDMGTESCSFRPLCIFHGDASRRSRGQARWLAEEEAGGVLFLFTLGFRLQLQPGGRALWVPVAGAWCGGNCGTGPRSGEDRAQLCRR